MSDTQDDSERTDDARAGVTEGPIGRRRFLVSTGVATVALASTGNATACPTSTTGERYGYGDQYYGFSGYGGTAPPCVRD